MNKKLLGIIQLLVAIGSLVLALDKAITMFIKKNED